MNVEQVVFHLTADISQYLRTLDYAGARLLGFTSAMLTSVASHGIALATNFQRQSIAFESMTKNAIEGKKMINELTELAVQTPFKSQELLDSAKQLKAFGLENDNILPTIRMLGEVSAGTGTSLERLGLAYGQVSVAGKLLGTELRQFVDAGVPLIEALSHVMGKPKEAMRSLVEQGFVGFPEVVKAFKHLTEDSGLFAGMMERVNKETIYGQWQSFSENLEIASRNFALSAAEGVGLIQIINSLSRYTENFRKNTGGVKEGFREVRDIAMGVWEILKKLGESLYAWGERNKELIAMVALLATTRLLLWGIHGVALLLLRVALWSYWVSGIRMVVVGLKGIISLMIAMTSVSGIASFFSAILTFLNPINLLVASLLVAIAIIGAFSMPMMVRGGIEIFSDLKEGFEAFITYLKSGDTERAWLTVVTSMKMIWEVFVRSLEFGLKKYIDRASYGLVFLFQWTTGQKTRDELRGERNNVLDQERIKEEEAIQKMSESFREVQREMKKLTEQAKELQKAMDFKKIYTDWASDNARDIHQKVFEYRSMLRDSGIRDNQWGRYNEPGNVKVYDNEMYIDIKSEHFQQLAKHVDDARREYENMKKGLPNIWKEVSDPNSAFGVWRKAFNLGEGNFQRMVEKGENPFKFDLIPKSIRDMAKKIGEMTGLGGYVLPAWGNENFLGKLKVPEMISGMARELGNTVVRQTAHGIYNDEQFRSKFDSLREAFYGTQMREINDPNFVGPLQRHATDPNLWNNAIINRRQFEFEAGKFYHDLRKSLGADSHMKGTAPALSFGSQEAETAIAFHMNQQVSVEEEVLATLKEANEIAKRQEETNKRIAIALENNRRTQEQNSDVFVGPPAPR